MFQKASQPLLSTENEKKKSYCTQKLFIVVSFFLLFSFALVWTQHNPLAESGLQEVPVGGAAATKCKKHTLGIDNKDEVCAVKKGAGITNKFACDVTTSWKFSLWGKNVKKERLYEYVKKKLVEEKGAVDGSNAQSIVEKYIGDATKAPVFTDQSLRVQKKIKFELQQKVVAEYVKAYNFALKKTKATKCVADATKKCNSKKEMQKHFITYLTKVKYMDSNKKKVFEYMGSIFKLCTIEKNIPKYVYFLGGRAGSGKSTMAKTVAMFHAFMTRAKEGHRMKPIRDGKAPELSSVRLADGDDYRSLAENYQDVLNYAGETGCGGPNFASFLPKVTGKKKKDFKHGIIKQYLGGTTPIAVIVPTVWSMFDGDRGFFQTYFKDPTVVPVKFKWNYDDWNAANPNDKFKDVVAEMGLNRFKDTGKPPPTGVWPGEYADGLCDHVQQTSCKCGKIEVPWSVDLAAIRARSARK